MSEWKKVRLGELCDFINGGAWSDKEYAPEGIPVLKVTNCKNSGFSLSELSYLPHSLEQKYIQNKLQRNDVIIATVGSHPNLVNSSAGRSVIVNSFVEGFYLNQNAVCIRTKDEEILDQLFWGYYSKYYLFQNYIQMRGKGAANQMRIAISAIKNYPMPLPPINVQRHIASILSRYDSLIENYQKQIKLLEEAARRLYKEWFIDLRFPGHENTKIVDGVPEGWEKKSIGDIGEYLNGFAFKPSDWQDLGKPIIKIKEMGNGVTNDTPRNNGERVPAKYLIKAGDLLFSWSATLMVIIWSGEDGWLNQHLFKVTPAKGINREFLLQSISNTIVEFQNLTTGSTMKHIQRNKLDQVFVNVPNAEIMKRYTDISEKTRSNILSLQSQIRLLTEARDRLLPKLMSGEITV